MSIRYKEAMSELTETCPNQHVIDDKKLIENFRVDSNLSKVTKNCQLSVIYHVLIRTCLCQFGHCFLVVIG